MNSNNPYAASIDDNRAQGAIDAAQDAAAAAEGANVDVPSASSVVEEAALPLRDWINLFAASANSATLDTPDTESSSVVRPPFATGEQSFMSRQARKSYFNICMTITAFLLEGIAFSESDEISLEPSNHEENDNNMMQPQDIAVENLKVQLLHDDNAAGVSDTIEFTSYCNEVLHAAPEHDKQSGITKILQKYDRSRICSVLSKIGGIDFISRNSRGTRCNCGTIELSHEIFERLGVVLFVLFTGGATPPSDPDYFNTANCEGGDLGMQFLAIDGKPSVGTNRTRDGNEICSDDYYRGLDEKEGKEEEDGEGGNQNEEVPLRKGRRFHARNGTRKSIKGMKFSNLQTELEKYFLPLPICRLIADLIHCRKLTDDTGQFNSIEDVWSEINQIMAEPELFLAEQFRNTDAICEGIKFDNTALYGRIDEQSTLLAAAEASRVVSRLDASSVVLLGGDPGVGKSQLVENFKTQLEANGWLFFSCKFDRLAQTEPLSTISSDLDPFFESIAALKRSNEDRRIDNDRNAVHDEMEFAEDYLDTMLSSILNYLSHSGIVFMSALFPSFKALFPEIFQSIVRDDDESVSDAQCAGDGGSSSDDCSNDGEEKKVIRISSGRSDQATKAGSDESDSDDGNDCLNASTSRNRLHYLFRRLLRAISIPGHRPLVFFMDDLQWADHASLSLLSSLVLESDHLNAVEEEEAHQSQLIICSYRSNELDRSPELKTCLDTFEAAPSVRITSINLEGIDKSSTNTMISDTLKLPLRLTRSLANAVHTKSAGNPLFAKMFMVLLAEEKKLNYSLEDHRWQWDMDVVRNTTINESVAVFMMAKLSRLPKATFEALQVMACFGVKVDEQVLRLLSETEEFAAIFTSLERAIQEGIIEKRNRNVFIFAHDTIQQSVYDFLPEYQMAELHFRIGLQLVKGLSTCEHILSHSISFIAIDQINKAKDTDSASALSPQLKEVMASLNLSAAELALDFADASSALSYVHNGFHFIGENGWGVAYKPCLRLHEAACLASYLNASPAGVSKYSGLIMEHARVLEDKIKASCVVIQTSASNGDTDGAINSGLDLLRQLGEVFPRNISRDDVLLAFRSEKEHIVSNETKSLILNSSMQIDVKKKWSLKLMDLIAPYLFVLRPNLLSLIAKRMVDISFQHGFVPESATGFFLHSYTLINIFDNIEEGYRWEKLALVILDRFDAHSRYPKVKFYLTIFAATWKVPFQSSIVELQSCHRELLLVGDIEFAAFSSQRYIKYCIVCGKSLIDVEKECAAISMEISKLNQMNKTLGHMFISSPLIIFLDEKCNHMMVLELIGERSRDPFALYKGPISNCEDLLAYASNNGLFAIMQTTHLCRLVLGFFFERYTEAASMAEQFRQCHKGLHSLNCILHAFFEGLVSFQLARRSETRSKWITLGEAAIETFRSWVTHSSWNFENKLALLEAESYFCRGKYNEAENKYEDAIKYSRIHRFVHEEAIAMELYSSFLKACGRVDEYSTVFVGAMDCYKKWGAYGVVKKKQFQTN